MTRTRTRTRRRRRLGEFAFEVFVAEAADDFVFGGGGVVGGDVGVGDAVEGGGFDHGVVGHVSEDDSLIWDEGFVEGVFVDDVAGEAAHAAEFVGVGFFAGEAAADDVGAVGHFEGVRHVAGGGGVEDGCGGLGGHDVHDGGDEVAGVEGDGFAGLEVDVFVPAGFEVADDADEAVGVVVVAGDVVAAAHVDPLDLFEEFGEAFFDSGEGALEDVGVLIAESEEDDDNYDASAEDKAEAVAESESDDEEDGLYDGTSSQYVSRRGKLIKKSPDESNQDTIK